MGCDCTRLACDWAAELALRQSCDSCSCDSCHTSDSFTDSCDSRQLLDSADCDDCRQRRAVVTGCVVFQHLLGHDVALLRAQLTAVRDVPQPLRAELVRGLLLGDTKAAATLLAHHEQRMMTALLAADTVTTACDTAARWHQRATEFCQWRHALTLAVKLHLPFPERYLARLAARDEWLAFLLFAQIYQYPRDQVLRLSAGFSQSSLRQTLGCALRCLLLTRPAGKSSRRRVTSDTEHEWSTASPETSVSSSPPGGAGGPPTPALTAVPPSRDAPPQSMLAAVVEAAADPCPGRALLQAARQMALPALAALATECEDVSAGDCLCGWLETSLSAPTPAEEAACVRLKRLALLAVRTRRLRSLDRALAVFFPDCALRLTIQLLESLMTLEEPHLPAELMLNMMEALRNTTKQQDSELFIYDRHWLSTTVLSLLLSSLSTLLTSAGRARLLGLMIDARLVEMLVTEQAERPDLPLLLRLSTVLGPSAVRLDWLTALPPGGGAEQLRLEASRAVAALCTAGELERADRLALAAGVSPDPVVLTQVTSDLREVGDEDRVTFWRQCSGRFTEKQLSRTEAVAFFRKHAETALSVSERYVCLKLAWDWLSPDRRADPDCDITALERSVWTAYTWARINGEMVEEPEPSPTPSPTHQPLLYRRPLLASGRRPVQPALTPDQLSTVRAVLGQLVDEGHLRQALLVAECFGVTTPDLERMVRLLKLAERVGRQGEDEVSLESAGGEPTTAAAAAAASAAATAANSTTTAASAVSSSQPAACPKVGDDGIATTEAGATARGRLGSAAVSTEITEAAAAVAGMDDRQHNSSEMDPNNSQTALGDSRLEPETLPDVRPDRQATAGSSGTGQSRETTPESGGGWTAAGASSIQSETLATDADSVQPDPPSVHPDPSVDNQLGDNNEERREEDGRRRSIGFCSSLGRSWKHSLFCSTPDARQPQSPSELSQLTELVAALRHGSEIGQRVLSCARAATDLQTTYQEVVLTREPLLLLSSVLTGDPAGVDRYRLAADLIHGLQLPDSQVTEVILAQVIAQVKAGVSELDPLLALCPDPVLLGNRLLDTAEDLASFPEADGYGDDCQVGLLVAAHSAHTARLNLQGIGDVMGRARQLVRRLLVKEDFRLMVSLLLGLGRYEEMAYVFELLLREDRLERLLTAGVSDGRLGAALRRHLIRHHPEDTARLRLVTGRFGHHAEAAADWQSRAEQLITSVLQSGPDEHCTETGQQRLREAMDCYRHAATFYRHAERLSSADASLCQAQLVALQISISSGALPLPEGVRPLLLRRSHQQLHTLLTETLPYRAARLVLRAYPDRPADWSQLLYRQYLCLGRDEYLTEYLQAEGHLDHSVIAGILKRIRGSARQFSPSRLRRLTLAAAGPELQYRAASQLQLRDVIGALLDTAEAGWLRDTVWKTGGM
ncbi:uncharacterized protein LOC122392764 [Amphibalanus amphitrite]|uniref:uncharacterized protein LOC122392764 n=1 Tax=Amphibalanus amphitrite TaxID=1232801 RepID=UPI001C90845A|nr:uncharacterized protein LOC122392764 [Amphibalanus amphitrite]